MIVAFIPMCLTNESLYQPDIDWLYPLLFPEDITEKREAVRCEEVSA